MHTGALSSTALPASTWLEEWRGTERDAITLAHLMRHESGLEVRWDPDEDGVRTRPTETQIALALPLVRPPGDGVMTYNNHGAQLVAEILRRATGLAIDAWLDREVFHVLGIAAWTWQRDAHGVPYGMSGLNIAIRDLARLGELLLADGEWAGQRLLPAGWFGVESTGAPFGLLTMQRPFGYIAAVDLSGSDLPSDLRVLLEPHDGRKLPVDGPGGLFAIARGDLDLESGRTRFRAMLAAAPSIELRPLPAVVFGHNGSGGQHLWVMPSAGVVGVQMRRWGGWDDQVDGEDFPDLLIEAFA